MGGSTKVSSPPPPEPLDPGKVMGEYMFGQGFTNYQGITDPRLQDRLIGAEARYRPQYAALELADINTFATGIPGGTDNPQYRRLEAQLAGLEAGEGGISNEEAMKIARSAAGPAPSETKFIPASTYPRGGKHPRSKSRTVKNTNYQKELEEYNREVQSIAESLGGNRASQIASVKAEMAQLESSPGQRGLFDLLEEQSTRAGALQREQLQLQREADVGALQEFAPQVVEAYRAADPASTAIAERMSRRAMGELTPEEERNIQQRSRQASLARGRIGDSSSLAAEALGRSDYTSQFAQPAFAMNRQLAGDVGMTILGRPSASIGLGGQVLGQAQQGAAGPMGPQLFDPNMGINLALQQRGQDINYQGAMAQAGASRSAGKAGMFGSILGGVASAIPFCWVAREVYGIENPKWLEFRYWMLNDAPSWFRNLYIKYGEKIAKFISNKPFVKSIIRKWMNTKIK
jgi:hypothetical protein